MLHFLVAASLVLSQIGATSLLVATLGAEALPQAYVSRATLLICAGLFVIPLIDRWDRLRTFTTTLVVFALILGLARVSGTGAPEYGYRALYPLVFFMKSLVYLQFWLIAAEICEIRQAKRIFPILLGLSLAGGLLAAIGASLLPFLSGWLQTQDLLLVAAALLVAAPRAHPAREEPLPPVLETTVDGRAAPLAEHLDAGPVGPGDDPGLAAAAHPVRGRASVLGADASTRLPDGSSCDGALRRRIGSRRPAARGLLLRRPRRDDDRRRCAGSAAALQASDRGRRCDPRPSGRVVDVSGGLCCDRCDAPRHGRAWHGVFHRRSGEPRGAEGPPRLALPLLDRLDLQPGSRGAPPVGPGRSERS